ncbi:hypothetical protein, partial [Xanthomonas arboricola]|uniref:[protein-PII] uridylyltransferase family protein n=1 Tax=Xanthomonas arboricola TaxID=56448 RepID=UPI003CCF37ED
ADNGHALTEAYRFLRRLENRLQMLRDAQTHALPQAPLDRERIAQHLQTIFQPAQEAIRLGQCMPVVR